MYDSAVHALKPLLHILGRSNPISGLPIWLSGKESTCQCSRFKRLGFDPWVGKNPGGGNGTHSSILPWKIPWTEEPGGLQFMGLQRVRHNWADMHNPI